MKACACKQTSMLHPFLQRHQHLVCPPTTSPPFTGNLHLLDRIITVQSSCVGVVHTCTRKPRHTRNLSKAVVTLLTALHSMPKHQHTLFHILFWILTGTNAEARPGVMRLMDEARQAGIKVAVCSAATKSSVIHVVKSLLGDERFQVISHYHCLCISPLNQPKSVCCKSASSRQKGLAWPTT